jgi:hypothetical protein
MSVSRRLVSLHDRAGCGSSGSGLRFEGQRPPRRKHTRKMLWGTRRGNDLGRRLLTGRCTPRGESPSGDSTGLRIAGQPSRRSTHTRKQQVRNGGGTGLVSTRYTKSGQGPRSPCAGEEPAQPSRCPSVSALRGSIVAAKARDPSDATGPGRHADLSFSLGRLGARLGATAGWRAASESAAAVAVTG